MNVCAGGIQGTLWLPMSILNWGGHGFSTAGRARTVNMCVWKFTTEATNYFATFPGSLPPCHLIPLEATDGLMNQTQLRSLLCQCREDRRSTSCIVQCNRCPIVHWACFLIPRRRRESYFEFVRRKGVVWKWTPLNRLKTAHAASLLKVSPWKNFRLKKYLLGSMKT